MPLSDAVKKVVHESDRLALLATYDYIQNAAASQIQQIFRDWSLRRKVIVQRRSVMQKTARLIQAWCREWLSRRRSKRHHAAACQIQRVFRAWSLRRKVVVQIKSVMDHSARLMQACCRAF